MKLQKFIVPVLFFCGFFSLSFQAQTPAKAPKDVLIAFFKWIEKDEKMDEGQCFTQDGYDVTKIDDACVKKYLQYVQTTNYFSSVYIKKLGSEFDAMKAAIRKDGYAGGRDADRYYLSQDPPSTQETVNALSKSSTTQITGTKATVTINFKQPYKYTLRYKLDLENNQWKISEISN